MVGPLNGNRVSQSTGSKGIHIYGGSTHGASSYNTSLRDDGNLKVDEWTLITFIYNDGREDLYYTNKHYGNCHVYGQTGRNNNLDKTPWNIGGEEGQATHTGTNFFCNGEITSVIIFDEALTIEEVMDVQEFATTMQPGLLIQPPPPPETFAMPPCE